MFTWVESECNSDIASRGHKVGYEIQLRSKIAFRFRIRFRPCEHSLLVHSHLWFITRLWFFSMQWIGIAIPITKMGVQPILEPNGNHNRNGVINLRCEWTLNVNNASCHTRTKPIVLKHFVWHMCMKCEQIDRYRYNLLWLSEVKSSSCHERYWCYQRQLT